MTWYFLEANSRANFATEISHQGGRMWRVSASARFRAHRSNYFRRY